MSTGDLNSKSGVQTNTASALRGLIARLWTGIRAAISFRVPPGYQDETGFHFGVERGQNETGYSVPAENPN